MLYLLPEDYKHNKTQTGLKRNKGTELSSWDNFVEFYKVSSEEEFTYQHQQNVPDFLPILLSLLQPNKQFCLESPFTKIDETL